ncbi:MAG: right-handed parallel beta-helix repeat-containing protein [Planctomycetota bacterium]
MKTSIRRFLLPAVLSLTAPGSLLADTFVVAPPFSLQSVVNAALANSDPHDTIRAQPGTYAEMVTIDYTTGTGAAQESLTIIRNTSTRPKVSLGFLIRDSRLVTISGFKVDSVHDDGTAQIRIRDSVGVAIVDCIGVTGDDGGVDANTTFEVIVDKCVFSGMEATPGTGIGVFIEDTCSHMVRDTFTEGNESWGIVVNANSSLVQRCTSRSNGAGGIRVYGLQNDVKSNQAHLNTGIGIHVVGVCDIKSNTASTNTSEGIRYGESGLVTFTGGSVVKNKTNGNGGIGLSVRNDQEGADVSGNSCKSNSGGGIKIAGSFHKLRKNNCRNNSVGTSGGHGILIASGSNANCLVENVTKGNSGDGIRVSGDQNFLKLNRANGSDSIVESAGAAGNEGYSNVAGGVNDFP